MLAYWDAQNDYADMNKDKSGQAVYAQRIVSSPGKKDGLYWPTSGNEKPSPLGEAVAAATQRGYRAGAGEPFYGYYYKVLTRQGPTAPGGAVDYVVNGNMIGGFGLVAYPAEYGNSGIMTFIINNDGDIYEKDLGSGTAQTSGAHDLVQSRSHLEKSGRHGEITPAPCQPAGRRTSSAR